MIRPEHEMALKDALGADDMSHKRAHTLWDHLKGTHDLLESWGAAEHVCLAGLFHSIYSTQQYPQQCLEPTLDNRVLIVKLIGEKAEFLAYVFHKSDRLLFLDMGHHEASQDLKDLLEIECANLLEQGGNEEWLGRLVRHPAISDRARAAIRAKFEGLQTPARAVSGGP
jgi:hypothetical protein